MKKQEFIDYIKDHYKAEPEYPWDKYPSYVVFRHKNNNKWFVLIMDVTADKLCGDKTGKNNIVSIIDIKVSPELTSNLRSIKGVYPAYHMNKEHWISIQLDSDINNDELKTLVDNSYNLTK